MSEQTAPRGDTTPREPAAFRRGARGRAILGSIFAVVVGGWGVATVFLSTTNPALAAWAVVAVTSALIALMLVVVAAVIAKGFPAVNAWSGVNTFFGVLLLLTMIGGVVFAVTAHADATGFGIAVLIVAQTVLFGVIWLGNLFDLRAAKRLS